MIKSFLRSLVPLFFLLIAAQSHAQTMKVSGTVYDTTGIRPLPQALAMAVRMKDSLLLGFTRTDASGSFTLSGFKIDTFTLVVASPGYDDKSYYIFGHSENYQIDIPSIRMSSKSQELEEVVIYANKNPIYYKGDTLVYVADSFKVNENAVVEDLLKKLPGISIDKDGKITSQGKEISQVLVDGDEFFGTDPTIATKNLGANGVETVQVYEKKNENAGEGEEETIKVLDLRLKDDAKKGYFGKVSAASDAGIVNGKPFYEGELLFNRFTSKQKISVFVLGANTPKSNFGFGDMAKFGLDNERASSGMSMWNQRGTNNTSGIPQTLKAGIYYNDKIGQKVKVGFNYAYYDIKLNSYSSSRSQYFLADSSYFTKDSLNSISHSQSHRFNAKVTANLDSLTILEFQPSVTLDYGQTDDLNTSEFLSETEVRSLATSVGNQNKSTGLSSSLDAGLKRKFMKPRRELEVKYILSSSDNKNNGNLLTTSVFDLNPALNDTIDQSKLNNNGSMSHYGFLEYTEPLSEKFKIKFDYMYEYGFTNQKKETRNALNGEYTEIVDYLSNTFKNIRQQNRFATELIFTSRKHTAKAGLGIRNIDIENRNLISGEIIPQNFTNLLPRASYMYKPSQSTRFNVGYRTNSSQPSITALQPVPDNTNPNQIREGNPDLKPNYVHTMDINFNTWKALSGRYLWSGAMVTVTDDAFANSTNYDDFGRTVSKTVNVDGNTFANVYIGGGLPFFSRKLEINPNANASYNKYSNFINDERNVTQNTTLGGGLDIELKFDSLEFSIGNTFNYNSPVSSLNTGSNTPFTSQEYTANINWTLPHGFRIKADGSYQINSQRLSGYNLNIFLVNAEVSKSFMKTQNLIVSLIGNDILNQNINVQRTVNGNIITDNYTRIISRYFLLKVTYKFNSNKTKEEDFSGWH